MSLLKKLIGKIFLLLRSVAESYEIEEYKKNLAACGKNVHIGRNCKIIPKNVYVGNDVVIGEASYLMATLSDIHIGNHVVMAPGVIIRGGDHRYDVLGRYIIDIKEEDKLAENDQDIWIEDDVWIGQGAIILKGVTIGEGCVIGAGAVVSRSIDPYTIYVGSHAPFKKRRFTDEEIIEHKALLTKRIDKKSM